MTANITPEGLREKDLAMLVARMARALRHNDSDNVLATEAVRYLKREQLLSPLRDSDEPDEDLQSVLASNEALVVTNAQLENKLAAALESQAAQLTRAEGLVGSLRIEKDGLRTSISLLTVQLAEAKAIEGVPLEAYMSALDRAERAEQQVAEQMAQFAERDAEVAALKVHAEAMAAAALSPLYDPLVRAVRAYRAARRRKTG